MRDIDIVVVQLLLLPLLLQSLLYTNNEFPVASCRLTSSRIGLFDAIVAYVRNRIKCENYDMESTLRPVR